DFEGTASYYTVNASPGIAQSIERRFIAVVERICRMPEAAPRVTQRSQVRVVTVVRYPFRIFYRVRGDTIDILHIRQDDRLPRSIPSRKDLDLAVLRDGSAVLDRAPPTRPARAGVREAFLTSPRALRGEVEAG